MSVYKANLSITEIVSGRAWVVDQILKLAWQAQPWPDEKNISLVAVGGYGRGELLPHSDIDILILTRKDNATRYKGCISTFLTLLWDIGLEIGQSVRSIKQCKSEAVNDIIRSHRPDGIAHDRRASRTTERDVRPDHR